MECLHFSRPHLAAEFTKREGLIPPHWQKQWVAFGSGQADPDNITGGVSIRYFEWNNSYAEYSTKLNQLFWYFLKCSCTQHSLGKPKDCFLLICHTFPLFSLLTHTIAFVKNWFSVFYHFFCPKPITYISNTTSKIFLMLSLPPTLGPSSWSKSSSTELWSTLPLTWAFNHVHLGWKVNYEFVVS